MSCDNDPTKIMHLQSVIQENRNILFLKCNVNLSYYISINICFLYSFEFLQIKKDNKNKSEKLLQITIAKH